MAHDSLSVPCVAPHSATQFDDDVRSDMETFESIGRSQASSRSPSAPRNLCIGAARNLRTPKLGIIWGGGLSLAKCHAERRVPYDPHLMQVWMLLPSRLNSEPLTRVMYHSLLGRRTMRVGCACGRVDTTSTPHHVRYCTMTTTRHSRMVRRGATTRYVTF